MRLIDADALGNEFDEQMYYLKWKVDPRYKRLDRAEGINWCRNTLNDAPTIDAKPVVRGHWEDCELVDGKDLVTLGYKRCSICHGVGFLSEDAYGDWIDQKLTDYCPNCGADMRGEQE